MKNKLFVGNLPRSASNEQLEEFFKEAGSVQSVKIITDRDTGQNKGYGFVEMGTDDEASKAIAELDGKELDGRPLRISAAKPQEKRGGGGGGRGGFGGGGSRRY